MLEKILDQKALISTILFAVLVGGIIAYMNIGKLEDAEIPIKSAMVITAYPGASAHEVELEVTDVLEKAIQKLENIKEIRSVSEPGLSKITIEIQSDITTSELPQLWDHLRRKVHDVTGKLPAGAYDPIVNDDFSDVYGILYVITADGYSHKELVKYAEFIEKDLLSIDGVRRSQLFGKQTEAVDIKFSSEKLASLNINPLMIAMAMQNQSAIINPGSIISGKESIRVGVGHKISSTEEIENLLIQVPGGGNFRLGEIAEVERSFLVPKREALYYNGLPGLTLGLSNESGINVVELGKRLDKELDRLQEKLPAGIEINQVYYQPDRVDDAVQNFMFNLLMSVGIVILVLLFSMGLRSGLLISSGLVFTILGTLIIMLAIDLPLHRITLATFILAMGMLVDNSIVVADGILVDLKRGINRRKAFVETAKRTAIPLLGATLVAILAFLPLRMAPNAAGEFLSSMFTVLIISLLLSWLFAMVQTPFMATYFYRKKRPEKEKKILYDSRFYRVFRKWIEWALHHKYPFAIGSIVILVVALFSFRFVKIDFMPKLEYDQFFIEYNLPQGTDINAVESDVCSIQDFIMTLDGVESVTTSIGRPPARYALMRKMPTGSETYGEVIVETDTRERVHTLIPTVQHFIRQQFPDAVFRIHGFGAAFSEYAIEAEFTGPDPSVLRQLANQAVGIYQEEPLATNSTHNWRNKTKRITPVYSVDRAQKAGLSRSDMGNSILVATNGMPVGAFYEGDKQLPVILKTSEHIDANKESLLSIPVWGQQSRNSVPLAQIVDTLALNWENQQIYRMNGKRAIKAQCDPIKGVTASELYKKIQVRIEEIPLPEGYSLTWDGEISAQGEANKALFTFLPLALGLMLIIVIGMFNNLKQPIIIFSIVPFAFIGIVIGLITTHEPLTFIGIIGALGLIGMMIKNSVVLLDEINHGIKNGKQASVATIDAAIYRLRPVMMASLTTILGMLPLLFDPLFKSMAVTIMFGLGFGTVITLMVVPVLYAVLFRVNTQNISTEKN
jgi:multidrug efflux pump subunit AcrB